MTRLHTDRSMTRYLLSLLTAALLVAASCVAGADEPPADADSEPQLEAQSESTSEAGQMFALEHRREIYEARRLSYRTALLMSTLPGLGNYYAEQYALGTIALGSVVFAGMFLGFGFTYNQSDLVWIGAGVLGGTYLWSGATTYFGVRDYNRQLRRNLHIDERSRLASPPAQHSEWVIGIGWKF